VPVLQCQWIDTEEALQELSVALEEVDTVAIDLEAHSHRSFAGIVCLMQISIRSTTADDDENSNMKNYLIDTLKLHHCINKYLASLLANPAIVKVLHGADADVQWLQRDFGLYVVNLFDTGRAARALQFPSAGYAYLLQHYCGITADKSHQLADWRQRPLPSDMQQYAVQDTHYLLDIYERLKWDLEQDSNDTSVTDVLDASRKVCLIRYCPEPFYPDGYRKLLRTRGSTRHELHHPAQKAVLKALWDWRDQTARTVDESLPYVCTNANLLRIALSCRRNSGGNSSSESSCSMTVTQLQGLFNPIPPLILRHSQDIVELIKQAVQESDKQQQQQLEDAAEDDDDDDDDVEVEVRGKQVGAPSSAFFKPANTEKEQKRRGMMSPVLGTEALYKQAGWMTPLDISQDRGGYSSERADAMLVELATTTDDDDGEDDQSASGKPKKLLSVHASNQDYHSKKYTDHSLELGTGGRSRGRSIDGLGSVRASRSLSPTRPNSAPGQASDMDSLEEEVKGARENAIRIKRAQKFQNEAIPAVLGLVASKGADEEDDEDDGARGDNNEANEEQGDGSADLEEEFIIPRSIREIYIISNRNRRNKKAGSPTPERGVTPTSEKEREELARAEALLKERGEAVAGYFDENVNASPGKRPRTKSGRESEESIPDPSVNVASKEDDLAFMKDIGWIQSKEEVDGILNQRFGRNRGSDSMATGGGSGDGAADERPDSRYEDTAASQTAVGVIHPSQQQPGNNPFFTGAAAQGGGPLTQQSFGKADPQQGQKKTATPTKGKPNRNRQQERPEKKDSRTHAYRKR
jgi:ribonuclease D